MRVDQREDRAGRSEGQTLHAAFSALSVPHDVSFSLGMARIPVKLSAADPTSGSCRGDGAVAGAGFPTPVPTSDHEVLRPVNVRSV